MGDAILIRDDAHWRELRSRRIGSSEVACLFDRSPYLTMFTLWHEKAGLVGERDVSNERTEWGTRLEPAIALGVADKMRWKLSRAREYWDCPTTEGMACTLDYDIVDHADGPGILEIKFVAAYSTWATDWSDDRAPACFELQLQHQLRCTGRPWGAIAVFIGETASLNIYERKADKRVGDEIERRIEVFWATVRDKIAPSAVGTAEEWAMLKELYPAIDPKKTISVGDERLSEVAQLFVYGRAQRRAGEDIEAKAKTQLAAALGNADTMLIPHYVVRQRPHGKGRVVTVAEAETGVAHTVLTPTIELA